MIDIFNGIISLFIIIGLGHLFISVLLRKQKMSMLLKLAFSYGIGAGILSYAMLIGGIMGLPLDFIVPQGLLARILVCIVLWGFIGVLEYSGVKTVVSDVYKHAHRNGTPVFWWMLLFIGSQIAFVWIFTFISPIVSWDAVATHSFKAKIFFYDRALLSHNLPHGSYPLLVPLTQAWMAFSLGEWNNYLLKIIFPVAWLSYVILHYEYLRTLMNAKWACGGVALLVSSSFFTFHATIAYTDIFMAYFNCATILLLLIWARQPSKELLILGAMFSGFTSFVKLEGCIYLLVHIFIVALLLKNAHQNESKQKCRDLLTFATISGGICLFYILYKYLIGVHGMESRLNFSFSSGMLESVVELFDSFLICLLAGNWNIIWLILIYSLCVRYKRLITIMEARILGISLLLFFLCYVFFFLFTQAPIDYPTTISRVVLHFFPLSTFLIVILKCAFTTKRYSVSMDLP